MDALEIKYFIESALLAAGRPAEAVAEEIAGLPTDHVYFCDDENFIDVDFAWRLAEGLERAGVRKRYFAWTRSTTVNGSPASSRELSEALRSSGTLVSPVPSSRGS